MLQVVNKEMQSLLFTFNLLIKKCNLYCSLLIDFTSCFRVFVTTLSKYLFAGKGLLGQEKQ